MRWILCLQEYDFKITQCKGTYNVVADFFSRNLRGERSEGYTNLLIWNCMREASRDVCEPVNELMTINTIKALNTKPELVSNLKQIKDYQRDDQHL